jgi:phosphoglycerate dehydrogenase-like enzyme
VDDLPFDAIRKDIFIANTAGAKPVPFAEGAIALLLALAKQIFPRHSQFPKRTSLESINLREKKVGIIGLGQIGIEIAKRLKAFEMTILGLKRRPSEELKTKLGLEFLGSSKDLPYLLKESDFVILTIPLTPLTRGMIGENELRMMKPTAYLINIARAAIIEEEPLYRALKEGWIAGAGIDVWWNQFWWNPMVSPNDSNPSKYPVWELPNVITTPHNIGLSKGVYSEAALRIIMENINRIAAGKPPINQVDIKYQY